MNKEKMDGGILKIVVPIIIILGLLVIGIIVFSILQKKENNVVTDNGDVSYECTLTKTYIIDTVNSSNDEDYLYVTLKEYQSQGVYTVKVSKMVAGDLEIGENYEFTFNTHENYVMETPDLIFDNSALVDVVHSDRVGMDQKNEFNCE